MKGCAVEYIIEFLLGEDNMKLSDIVSYGDDDHAKVIIVPSHFFDEGVYLTKKSVPKPPLTQYNGIPILYGQPFVENKNDKLFIYMDLVASSFFFLSRYEECIFDENTDKYGRYIGKGSFSHKNGLLGRPIVDEYSELLIGIMNDYGYNVNPRKKGLERVYLTHDIDDIWCWDTMFGVVRSIVARILRKQTDVFLPLKGLWSYEKYDPIFTFPFMVETDICFKSRYKGNTTVIFFVKGDIKKTLIDHGYIRRKLRVARLIDSLSSNGCEIQYHMSYDAAVHPEEVKTEVARLNELTHEKVTKNRNHFLASRIPMGYETLIENGIIEDYSMAYQDVIGFRIGTCRPVRWINPYDREVKKLMLHPLTVMECTLYDDAYMGIKSKSEAFETVKTMIDYSCNYGGEVSLLWHNTSFVETENGYYRELYIDLLNYIDECLVSGRQTGIG